MLCEVTETYENDHDGAVVDVTIRDRSGAVESVAATREHPFWVVGEAKEAARAVRFEGDTPDGGAWVGAQHLSLGDQLLTAHGQSATVIGLQVRNERLKVYNLNVLRLHNFAVGDGGVLVHNRCTPNDGKGPKHGGTKHNSAIDQKVAKLTTDKEVRNIRKNQQQVDVDGNNVGRNRPDLQWDQMNADGTYTHINQEFDNYLSNNTRHLTTNAANDPDSMNFGTFLR